MLNVAFTKLRRNVEVMERLINDVGGFIEAGSKVRFNDDEPKSRRRLVLDETLLGSMSTGLRRSQTSTGATAGGEARLEDQETGTVDVLVSNREEMFDFKHSQTETMMAFMAVTVANFHERFDSGHGTSRITQTLRSTIDWFLRRRFRPSHKRLWFWIVRN